MTSRLLLVITSILLCCAAQAQCLAPSTASISGISETEATLNWIEFGDSQSWDVLIVAVGEGTSATPTASGLSSTEYSWTNGMAGEVYDVYIRANCQNGNTTPYAGPITFQHTPVECVTHVVYDPPLVFEADPAIDCDVATGFLDFDLDGTDDLFIQSSGPCENIFTYVLSPSSVRINPLGVEGMQFVANEVTLDDGEGQFTGLGMTPMNLGQIILTEENSILSYVVDHGNEYSAWDGIGVRYIGFDLFEDGQRYNGWVKAVVAEQSMTVLETAFDNRINNNMSIGQTDCVYCPADIVPDGVVDVQDFLSLNSAYNSDCLGCVQDLNGSGTVDVNDFILFNSAFGLNCDDLLGGVIESDVEELYAALQTLDDTEVINEDLMKQIDFMRAEMFFSVYPNPSTGDYIGFDLLPFADEEAMVRVSLTDLAGRTAWSTTISAAELTATQGVYPDARLTTGMYLLTLDAEGHRISRPLVID